jgi:ribosome maturation factor RimP
VARIRKQLGRPTLKQLESVDDGFHASLSISRLVSLIKKRYTSQQLFLESLEAGPKPASFSWDSQLEQFAFHRAFKAALERRVRCFIAVIEDIVHEALEPLGFEALEVVVSGGKRTSLVLVRIDRLDEQPVTTTDLERASRALGLELDKHDPIQGEYRLELESPGPKRPLIRQRHFERMLGLKAKVKVAGVGGFIGQIVEVTPDTVTLEGDARERRSFPLAGIVANLAEFPDRHR